MSLSYVIEWLRDFAQAYHPLLGSVATVAGLLFGWRNGLWSRLVRKIGDVRNTDVQLLKAKNAELIETLNRVRVAFDDDNNIWLRRPVTKQPEYYHRRLQDSIPILLIANLKGGVAKTTIAANLAVYFERRRGERVLAIDLDHRGSFSSMLLRQTRCSARSGQPSPRRR